MKAKIKRAVYLVKTASTQIKIDKIKYLEFFKAMIVNKIAQMDNATAGISNVPFASHNTFKENEEKRTEPVKDKSESKRVFKSKYKAIFPNTAKMPVTMYIDNSPFSPNLIRRELKKHMTGDKYILEDNPKFTPAKRMELVK